MVFTCNQDELRGSVNLRIYRALLLKNNLTMYMSKEIRHDVYTQAEYAKKIGVSRARVNQMTKNGELKTLTINGATLIKV